MTSLSELLEYRSKPPRDVELNQDEGEILLLWNGNENCIAVTTTPLDDGCVACEFAFFIAGVQVPVEGLRESIVASCSEDEEVNTFEMFVPRH